MSGMAKKGCVTVYPSGGVPAVEAAAEGVQWLELGKWVGHHGDDRFEAGHDGGCVTG